jgi:hypothetical protein
VVKRGVIGAASGLVSSLVGVTGIGCIVALVISKTHELGVLLIYVSYLIGMLVGLAGGWFGGVLSKRSEKRFAPAIYGALLGGGLATILTPMLVGLIVYVGLSSIRFGF